MGKKFVVSTLGEATKASTTRTSVDVVHRELGSSIATAYLRKIDEGRKSYGVPSGRDFAVLGPTLVRKRKGAWPLSLPIQVCHR